MLGIGLCTVIDIVTPGGAFGLGKKSDTIWTISSLKIVEIIGGNMNCTQIIQDHLGDPV